MENHSKQLWAGWLPLCIDGCSVELFFTKKQPSECDVRPDAIEQALIAVYQKTKGEKTSVDL